MSKDLKEFIQPKDKDGKALVQILRNGAYLTVFPPLGEGRFVDVDDVSKKLMLKGVSGEDSKLVRKIIKEAKGESVLISEQKPRSGMEAKLILDISSDKMKAKVTILPPRPGGRDFEVRDIVNQLKNAGVKYGFKEEEIQKNSKTNFSINLLSPRKGIIRSTGKMPRLSTTFGLPKTFLFEKTKRVGWISRIWI